MGDWLRRFDGRLTDGLKFVKEGAGHGGVARWKPGGRVTMVVMVEMVVMFTLPTLTITLLYHNCHFPPH